MKRLSQGHKRRLTRALRCACLASPVLGLTACAVSKIAQDPHEIGQTTDPWESWNRKVFAFNESLDRNLLKPVATAYSEIVPSPARQAASKFFGIVGDAWSGLQPGAARAVQAGRRADPAIRDELDVRACRTTLSGNPDG